MAKAPVAGRSKTRLARGVGVGSAMAFARHAARACILRLGSTSRWETIVAVTPDATLTHPVWPRGVGVMPQGRGDLGARMQRIFARLPPGPIVIVGSDIPAIRPHHIAHAFGALGAADAVLGPATDGGYWLVGLRRRPRCPAPFRGVRWSSPHALADTHANLAGATVSFAATLDDVDDAEGLRRNAGCVGRVVTAQCQATCYNGPTAKKKGRVT